MHRRLLLDFIVLCLGRQEPEGGVVLGIEIIFIIFSILLCKGLKYYSLYFIYYYVMITMTVAGFTLRMHPPCKAFVGS
jgi:hypothetical protein